jgi:hypothetical protein
MGVTKWATQACTIPPINQQHCQCNKEMSQIEEDSLRTLAEPSSVLEIYYQKT